MELKRVLEIHNYNGDLWYISPYIEDGKIVRNTIYKVSHKKYYLGWHNTFTFNNAPWGKGKYYSGSTPTSETEINVEGVRVFTTRKEAKQGLIDYEKFCSYKIIDSVKREIKRLENDKLEIDAKIAKLKETSEKAFKNISTTFSK